MTMENEFCGTLGGTAADGEKSLNVSKGTFLLLKQRLSSYERNRSMLQVRLLGLREALCNLKDSISVCEKDILCHNGMIAELQAVLNCLDSEKQGEDKES